LHIKVTHDDSSVESTDNFETIICGSGKEVGCCSCPPHFLEYLYKYNLHTSAFSNLYLAYKYIFILSAFSKLKIIKYKLRSATKEELLESLMLISIDADIIRKTDIIIDAIGRSSGILSNLLIV